MRVLMPFANQLGARLQLDGGSGGQPSRLIRDFRESTQPARASKQAAVIALLRRPEGATIDEVRAATGWQPHTVRGMFSGALKKKLGLAVIPSKEERGRVYRVTEAGA